MINSNNIVILTGNMTSDVESPKDGILKFGLAVNGSGYEGGETAAGFFDVICFTKGINEHHADFIKRQVAAGNFAKGSSVSIVGQLRHERWTQDDQRRSKITVVAESVNFAGGGRREGAEGGSEGRSETAPSAPATLPSTF